VSGSPLLRLLLRRGWLVPLAAVCAAAIAVSANHAFPRDYTASSSLVVPAFAPGAAKDGPKYADEADKLAVTYAAVIPLDPDIRNAVARTVGVSTSEASSRISVVNPPATAVLTLSYRGSSEQAALDGARALRSGILDGDSRAVPRQSVMALRSVAIETRPRKGATMIAIGIVLGTLLGLVLMIGWDRFDARIDDVETLREAGGRPATAFNSITLTSTPILLERWRELGATRRPRIALVPLTSSAQSMATELARQMAALTDHSAGRLDAGEGFTVVVETPLSRRRPVAVSPADLFILVVTRGSRVTRLRAAVNRLAEVGADPGWLLLAPRRWQTLPLPEIEWAGNAAPTAR
jgi:capsular polysaccharide biosynthesis protein